MRFVIARLRVPACGSALPSSPAREVDPAVFLARPPTGKPFQGLSTVLTLLAGRCVLTEVPVAVVARDERAFILALMVLGSPTGKVDPVRPRLMRHS